MRRSVSSGLGQEAAGNSTVDPKRDPFTPERLACNGWGDNEAPAQYREDTAMRSTTSRRCGWAPAATMRRRIAGDVFDSPRVMLLRFRRTLGKMASASPQLRWTELKSRMKSILVPGAIALSLTLSGVAFAADVPAAAPPPVVVVDPVTEILTTILTPVGNAANVVVQPVIVAPVNAVTAVLVPAPPPAAPTPAPVHHRRHHRHHHPK